MNDERDPLRSFDLLGEPFEKWDIGFDINAEILGNVMGFMGPFNDDVPIKFFADKLSIRQTNNANVAYTEIDVSIGKLQNYDANIGEKEINRSKVGSGSGSESGSGGDEPYKLVMISASDITDEVLSYVTKESLVTIKIDSIYRKTIQFSTPGGFSVWTKLLDTSQELKRLDSVRTIIGKVRSNINIPKAVLTFDAETFKKMCVLGAKAKDKTEFMTMQIHREKGIALYSESTMMGRVLRIGCAGGADDSSGTGDSGTGGNAGYGSDTYNEDTDDVDKTSKIETSNVNESQSYRPDDDYDGGDESDGGSNDSRGDDSKYFQDIMGRSILADTNIDKSKRRKGKEDKIYKKEKDKKDRSENIINNTASKLYQLDMNKDFIDTMFSREYLAPMLKLKGMGFVVMEVREGKPIIIEQELYDGCRVLLTIAPRMKDD